MSLRLFAALSIPDAIAQQLLPMQKGVGGASWRPRENFHITLRFFGSIPEDRARDLDSALEEAALRTRPFDVQVRGAGSFGGAEPHALIVRVEPAPALLKLAADCERAARRTGLKPETRKYAPHITLAYLHGAPLERVQAFERAHALFAPPAFRAVEMGLFSSHFKQNAPSLYRLEASYPLGG